ncbi:T9SS type A sorting domain-containing protein [Crocinitomix catalasitica]|nr:T9SS type A sorting domain-containing protein [Crocinitomix catalasitica]
MKKLVLFVGAMVLSFLGSSQSALNLDGIDDSLVIGSHSGLNITDEMTVELWVRQATVQFYPAFVSGYSDSISGPNTYWHGWWLGGLNDGRVTFWMADPTVIENGLYANSTTDIADATWHHIAGTFKDDTARVFVDGVEQGFAEIVNYSFNVDTICTMGVDFDAEWYNGGVEDVRIWNYARTESEIFTWKDSCLKGDEAGLMAYYHFEEGIGTTTEDLSGNGNDMDFYGTIDATWTVGLNCTYCDIQSNTGMETKTVCLEYASVSGSTYTTSGIYLDTLTNTSGCDSVVTLDLTVNTVDVTTSLAGITITANEAGASYQWIDCDAGNAIIPGETNQDFTPTANGNYAVIVDNGCVDTSACVSITSVNVEELAIDLLTVYPNPTEADLFVNFGTETETLIELSLTAISGQLIQSRLITATTHSIRIPLEGVDAGTYLLRAKAIESGFSKVIKVVVR